MVKLFKYEGYKLTISEEALLLKPFRELWERDKSADKNRALSEFGYMYFFCDPRSDYQYLVDEKERQKAIIEGEGLPKKWKPDELLNKAMQFYNTFKPTSALLLEDTRSAIDKLRKLLGDIDLTATDNKDRPIYTLNSITATIKLIPGLLKDLDEAEKAVNSDMKDKGRMRGQGEKTIFEDDL